jgi:Mg2+ and Co2+ transporter CorA
MVSLTKPTAFWRIAASGSVSRNFCLIHPAPVPTTALEELEAWLDMLDVRLLASKAADISLLKSVVSSRRYVSRMRRNLAPQRAVFYGLARPDFALVSGSEAKAAFEALEHRFDRVLGSVEHSRELVQGSFDLFSTRVNESTNVLIRRLTFVSIMLGTIGAVAGVFGMNFETPYTNSGATGFWMVVGGLIALSVVAFAVGLIRKWF